MLAGISGSSDDLEARLGHQVVLPDEIHSAEASNSSGVLGAGDAPAAKATVYVDSESSPESEGAFPHFKGPQESLKLVEADRSARRSVADAEHQVLVHIFRQTDAENKGFITGEQLRQALSLLGWNVPLQELITVVNEVHALGESNVPGDGLLFASTKSSVHFDRRQSMMPSVTRLGAMRVDFKEFCLITTLLQNQVRFEAFAAKNEDSEVHLAGARYVKHLLPDSPRRWYWSLVVVFAEAYIFFAAGFHIKCRTECKELYLSTLASDLIFSVLMVIDIFANLYTTYIHTTAFSRELVDDRSLLLRHNLRSAQFLVDVLACLPTYLLGVFGVLDVAKYFTLVRLLKVFFLQRMFANSTNVGTMTPANIHKYFAIGPVLTSVAQGLCLIHGTAIGFILISQPCSAVTACATASPCTRAQISYASAVYRSMYFFSTAGLGGKEYEPNSNEERWYMIIVMLVAMMVNGYVIGSVIQFIQKGDIDSARKERMLQLDAVLEFFELPEGLADEVRQLQYYLTLNNLLESHGQLMECLPEDIKINMKLYERIRAVSQVPFFADSNAGVRFGIAQLLVSMTFAPSETIIHVGEVGTEMFFLTYGFVDVLAPNGAYIVTLREGNYFGEVALLTPDAKRKATIRSLSYTLCFVLYGNDFQELIKRFPKFRQKIETTASKRLATSQKPPPPLASEPEASSSTPPQQPLALDDTLGDMSLASLRGDLPRSGAQVDCSFDEEGIKQVLLHHTPSMATLGALRSHKSRRGSLAQSVASMAMTQRSGSDQTGTGWRHASAAPHFGGMVSRSASVANEADFNEATYSRRNSMVSDTWTVQTGHHQASTSFASGTIFPHQHSARRQSVASGFSRAITPKSFSEDRRESAALSNGAGDDNGPGRSGALAALERITGHRTTSPAEHEVATGETEEELIDMALTLMNGLMEDAGSPTLEADDGGRNNRHH